MTNSTFSQTCADLWIYVCMYLTHQMKILALPSTLIEHAYFIFRFLMQVLGLVSNHIHRFVYSPLASDESLYLQEQFSHFLLYCIYMFESGNVWHYVCLISGCCTQNSPCFLYSRWNLLCMFCAFIWGNWLLLCSSNVV